MKDASLSSFQKGKNLSFPCHTCKELVQFSLFNLEQNDGNVCCGKCQQIFCFNDPNLLRQLAKFAALCKQVQESEEILSLASIGVDVGSQQVKIPFKLLLTRFNAALDLKVGEHHLAITFRLEPSQTQI